MMRRFAWASLLAGVLLPTFASAQGVLISPDESQEFQLPRHRRVIPLRPQPRPPQTYKIKDVSVNATLQDQVAKVQVSQSFVNTGSRQMEVSFVFPLPHDGAIDQMTFMVDGKEFEAKLLTSSEARRIYEGYVRRNKDPALMEWIGKGMFKTSVFPVPPGAERSVTIRYSQICKKDQGLTELLFPLSAAKYTAHPVENISINVTIRSQADIKNVYSPSHAVEIKRPTSESAVVSYKRSNEVPNEDFRLLYDVGDKAVGTSLISYRPNDQEDGYFLLLVSPEIKAATDEVVKKNVIFVVDRSGSMNGKKIEQAKGALRFVLNNLNEGDLFNIIAYDSGVESFQPELQRFNDGTRKQASAFIESIYAGGSTNIDAALQTAFAQLQDDTRPSYVIFLTDGLPTAGEKNETKIVENATQRNSARTRVFSFGVGYDVNSRLLDKLSRSGFGQSQYVRPNEDIEEQVSKLYNRIGAPVLTDLKITFDIEGISPDEGQAANRIYPKDAYDLFAGEQLVMAGRYKKGGIAKIMVNGKVGDEERTLDFPARFIKKSNDDTHAYVERLWAIRRVGEIIDEIDLKGQNQELVDELVRLSQRHGIITPYTSFLADENAPVRDLTRARRHAVKSLEQLSRTSGQDAFFQRSFKAELQRGQRARPAAQLAVPAPATAGRGGGAADVAFQLQGAAKVHTVGAKTFFRRANRWVDSTATEEQEKQPTKIERFSKEYFDLLEKHGAQAAKYLAIEGDVTVVLDGVAYSF